MIIVFINDIIYTETVIYYFRYLPIIIIKEAAAV